MATELADQASDQRRGQGFLPRSAVVCSCGFGLSPGSPLPGRAGLGLLGFKAVKDHDSEGQVCLNF